MCVRACGVYDQTPLCSVEHVAPCRLMCNAYLTFFMRDDLLDEMALYPYPDPPPQGSTDPAENFTAPSLTYSYEQARDKSGAIALILA